MSSDQIQCPSRAIHRFVSHIGAFDISIVGVTIDMDDADDMCRMLLVVMSIHSHRRKWSRLNVLFVLMVSNSRKAISNLRQFRQSALVTYN